MKLYGNMIYVVIIAFVGADLLLSVYEKKYKLTFRQTEVIFFGLYLIIFLLISLILVYFS